MRLMLSCTASNSERSVVRIKHDVTDEPGSRAAPEIPKKLKQHRHRPSTSGQMHELFLQHSMHLGSLVPTRSSVCTAPALPNVSRPHSTGDRAQMELLDKALDVGGCVGSDDKCRRKDVANGFVLNETLLVDFARVVGMTSCLRSGSCFSIDACGSHLTRCSGRDERHAFKRVAPPTVGKEVGRRQSQIESVPEFLD